LAGVYDPKLVVPIARTLALLGCKSALVVHGGGLDEIALHAPTTAARLVDGNVFELELCPNDAGVQEAPIDSLRGGEPKDNAALLTAVLQGRGPRAHRDAVAMNTGALLWISGRAAHLREGTSAALDVLASGRAYDRVERYARATRAAGLPGEMERPTPGERHVAA
jgi:anthranilate phosphoribosyltransferase